MKILFLSASPLTSARLDIELEAKAIRAALAASRYRDAITFIDESAVTPSDLVKLIDSVRPQILHFSGHGEEGGIVLRDQYSAAHVIRSGSLQRVLENRGIELLVLNACGSDEHAQSALLSVKTVVGTVDLVEDRVALAFSTAFYESIADGQSVATAFEQAQRIVDATGGPRANFTLRGNKELSFAPGAPPAPQPVAPPEPAVAAAACRLRLSKRGLPGVSHRLGSIHLHIDGAQATDLVRTTLAAHEKEGYTAEFSTVCGFVAGSQREDERDLYAIHTPGQEAKEELEFFSTTILFDGPGLPNPTQWYKIIGTTRDSLVRLFDFSRQREGRGRGVVLELERVAGDVDVAGNATMAQTAAVDADGRRRLLDPEQLLFTPNYPPNGDTEASLWYELHFSLDLPKRGEQPPVALERLNAMSREAGITVGGWFLFQDSERWAYRSNGFETTVSKDSLAQAWRDLKTRLDAPDAGIGGEYGLRLLAEESLAVWKSPLVKTAAEIMTLPELASWEGAVRPLSEFWVVAPNFLGDSDPAVARAMVRNIGQGTRYVYFLRSNADARRWLSFKSSMAALLGKDPRMDAYIVEFDDDFWSFNVAFIANPQAQGNEPREAVQLRTDSRSRRIIWGMRMPPSEIDTLCERLQGGIRNGNVRRWEHVDGRGRSTRLAALCVRFLTPLAGGAVDDFDELLAEKVSANQGEVIEYSRSTVVIAFHLAGGNVTAALRCAADLVGQLRKEGGAIKALYGIDASEATGVVRANGTVWEGSALEGCKQLIERHGDRAAADAILLSIDAAAMLDVGKDVWPDLKIEVGQGVHIGTVVAPGESAALAMVHVSDTG